MKIIIDEHSIKAFRTWNLHLTEKPLHMIVDALALLIGDYSIERKRAALMILKTFLKDEFLNSLLEDKDLYPTERDDKRVLKWRKETLAKGKCERCGNTQRLEAHHIIRWAEYPQGRIDIKNGMCLCHDCHTEEHYGERSYYMMKAGCRLKT